MEGKLRNMTSVYITKAGKMLLLFRQGSRVVNDVWTGSAGGHFEECELKEREVAIAKQKLDAEIRATADAEKYQKEQAAAAELFARQQAAEALKYEQERAAEARMKEAEAAKYAKEQEAAGISAVGMAEAEAIRAKALAEVWRGCYC